MPGILVVEDDENLNRGITFSLKKSGYEVFSAESVKKAKRIASDHNVDVTICDVNLPDGNGLEFVRWMRCSQNTYIICLTALDQEMDQVMGYEAGADDYITKPFSVNELLARISAHLRREQRSHNKTKSKFSEELVIDYSDRSLYIRGNKIELSNKEFEIIQLLSSNAGQVFDREKIYECIWGIDGNGDSVVIKEHIRKIRLKFSEFTDKAYITTVWGVGYKWEK